MVSHELPRANQPGALPVPGQSNAQPPSHIPWTDDTEAEQSDGVWEHVAPQGGAASSTAANTATKSHVPVALKPGQGLVNLGDDDENAWDEARKQPTESQPHKLEQIPDILKPGGSKEDTNPFIKRKPVAQDTSVSANAQAQSNSQPLAPTDAISKLDVNDANQNSNPWHQSMTPRDGSTGPHTPQPRPVISDGMESDPWAASAEDKPALAQPSKLEASPALISFETEDQESTPWKDMSHDDSSKEVVIQSPPTAMSDELLEDQHVWDDLGAFDKDKGKGKVPDVSTGQAAQLDDWSMIDAESSSTPPQLSKNERESAVDNDKQPPPLPSRNTGLSAKWVPSRPVVDGKAETYQIKNIRWHDVKSESNPRTSPILIQNENGPCPLVALVNALTMTTPSEIPDTALVQTLRSREQISLSLLLDAVFDELMSPRRTNSEDALPDVSDLYAFLQSLHTGMNVNPRFIPTPEMVNAYKRTSLTHLHPSERGNLIPGTFENTMEMSLYAAFSIPLIHGWLPQGTDPVYEAMERQACSYEDVQNLLFREEELEEKLSGSGGGLSEDEQQLYQDIITIRMFLASSATQLTAWGIEVIGKAMRPGTFAILFRNDHFSTLYCHPQTLQLLSLVTDAGYRTHDEVVWESLVDVNGERTDYLSGDFRVVGSADAAGSSSNYVGGSSSEHAGEWTTVQDKRGKAKQQDEDLGAGGSKYEQEDRDLALALQLQEEEDERHRTEQARRQRESVLSEQYIEQQGHRPAPFNRNARSGSEGGRGNGGTNYGPPGRRSSSSVYIPVTNPSSHSRQSSLSQATSQTPQQPPQQQQVRPLVPPRRPGVSRRAESAGEDAPPSYEQAAQDPAYVPPVIQPTYSQSTPSVASPVQNVPRQQGMGQTSMGHRRQGLTQVSSVQSSGSHGRDRECVVM